MKRPSFIGLKKKKEVVYSTDIAEIIKMIKHSYIKTVHTLRLYSLKYICTFKYLFIYHTISSN